MWLLINLMRSRNTFSLLFKNRSNNIPYVLGPKASRNQEHRCQKFTYSHNEHSNDQHNGSNSNIMIGLGLGYVVHMNQSFMQRCRWPAAQSTLLGPISRKPNKQADIWEEIWDKWGNFRHLRGNFWSATDNRCPQRAVQWALLGGTFSSWDQKIPQIIGQLFKIGSWPVFGT